MKTKIPILFLILSILISGAMANAEPKTIAIAPFDVVPKGDYNYLGTGVVDMLTSRLVPNGEIRVLEKHKTIAKIGNKVITRENAHHVLKKLNVDYLLFGIIIISPKGVSMESYMAESKKEGVSIFSQKSSQYESVDAVLLLTNRLVSDIRKKVLQIPPAAPETTETTLPETKSEKRNIHAHPDTLLKDLENLDTSVNEKEKTLNNENSDSEARS